jgi:hypothetical protein
LRWFGAFWYLHPQLTKKQAYLQALHIGGNEIRSETDVQDVLVRLKACAMQDFYKHQLLLQLLKITPIEDIEGSTGPRKATFNDEAAASTICMLFSRVYLPPADDHLPPVDNVLADPIVDPTFIVKVRRWYATWYAASTREIREELHEISSLKNILTNGEVQVKLERRRQLLAKKEHLAQEQHIAQKHEDATLLVSFFTQSTQDQALKNAATSLSSIAKSTWGIGIDCSLAT